MNQVTAPHCASERLNPGLCVSQVRILRLLRILGHNNEAASDTMNDLLAQVQSSRWCEMMSPNADRV